MGGGVEEREGGREGGRRREEKGEGGMPPTVGRWDCGTYGRMS